MSYKAEVIADNSGKWVGNSLAFETTNEARQYVKDLEWRWTAVRDTRTVASDEPVNAAWIDGGLVYLPKKTEADNESTHAQDG